jgi:hypothetical protein
MGIQPLTVTDEKLKEKLILLRKMFDGSTILAIGKELGDDYCTRFDDRGYDANYSYYSEEEAIDHVARLVTDERLLNYARTHKSALRSYWRFDGNYYTYDPDKKELTLDSNWPSIKKSLETVRERHGRATFGVLQAYLEQRRDWSAWSDCDYSQLAYRAEELGGEGWRKALIALEVAGVIMKRGSGKRPGERSVGLELVPLIQSTLEEWKQEYPDIMKAREIAPVDVVRGHRRASLLLDTVNIDWDPELAEKVVRILNLTQDDLVMLDSVMQTMTKLVESRLRTAVERFIQGQVIATESYGIRLLEFARKVGFIRSTDSQPEPVYFLFRWFFLEPRNISHHLFMEYRFTFVVTNLVITNILLKEINDREKGPRPITIPVKLGKSEYVVGEPIELQCEIRRADGSPLVDGVVTAVVQLPPGIRREHPLTTATQGIWSGSIPTVDAQPGMVSITVTAADLSSRYVGGSASVVSLVARQGIA